MPTSKLIRLIKKADKENSQGHSLECGLYLEGALQAARETEIAFRKLVAAEDASCHAFGAEQIDRIEAAMKAARAIIGDERI